MAEAERVDAYLDTVRRMEPDIAMVDRDAALASIAISLKRIADAVCDRPTGAFTFPGPLSPEQVEKMKELKRQLQDIADDGEPEDKGFSIRRRSFPRRFDP